MKILHRQILKDFLGPFLLAICVMTIILLMDKIFLLIDLLIRKGVNFWVVSELMLYSLPFVISFSVPIGVLIASVMVFGRITHDNELTAIRSAGINPLKLFVPLVILIGLVTTWMVFFNGYILPEATHRARNLLTDIAQKKPSVRIYEGVFLEDFPGYIIYFGSIDDRTGNVSDITIWQQKGHGEPPILMKAKSGRISTSPDEQYFVIELDSGEISELVEAEKYRHLSFTKHELNLEIDLEFIRRERKYRTNRELLLNALYQRLKNVRKELHNFNKEIKELKTATIDEVRKYHLEDLQAKVRNRHNEYNKLASEIEKRYALAFSCLIFLFFGAGLGMLLKRGGLGAGFVIGLLFFAGYYILFIWGEEMAQTGILPPFISIWFANLTLVPISWEILNYVSQEKLLTHRLLQFFKKA